jgi:hypothetical protein
MICSAILFVKAPDITGHREAGAVYDMLAQITESRIGIVASISFPAGVASQNVMLSSTYASEVPPEPLNDCAQESAKVSSMRYQL